MEFSHQRYVSFRIVAQMSCSFFLVKPCDKLSYDKDLTKLEEQHVFVALSLEWEKVHG